MNFKGEIDIDIDEYVYVIMIYICVKNGMCILILRLNVNFNRYYLIMTYIVVKIYGDIQSIHENCLNWYLRHEY